jgi:hypothetical protein
MASCPGRAKRRPGTENIAAALWVPDLRSGSLRSPSLVRDTILNSPFSSLVIPGRAEGASPQSITATGEYGFRAPSLRSGPGMTEQA